MDNCRTFKIKEVGRKRGRRMSTAETTARKETRLDVRLSHEQKLLLEEAAAASGMSTSAFVVQTVTRRAREVMADYRSMELSTAESRAFVDRLMEPGAPNDALRAAAKRYWTQIEASQ